VTDTVMAGAGPPSTPVFVHAEGVEAGLRRHDDVARPAERPDFPDTATGFANGRSLQRQIFGYCDAVHSAHLVSDPSCRGWVDHPSMPANPPLQEE
jgi:hypothetical protein